MKKVEFYTHAHGVVEVHFPEDKTVCQYCQFCRNEDSLKRWKCMLTGEYLLYPFHGRGNDCPLILEEKNNESL